MQKEKSGYLGELSERTTGANSAEQGYINATQKPGAGFRPGGAALVVDGK